jgi:hypothetical protein
MQDKKKLILPGVIKTFTTTLLEQKTKVGMELNCVVKKNKVS